MAKFVIDESFLEQIELLETLIKNNIAGLFGGNHQTRSFGSSCEFADHREYLAGDDVTKIDWNVFARTENLYLKQFLDERQMHTRIYVDASRSMDFPDEKKSTQALKLAAAFAYLSVCQMDKVSVYVIQEKEVRTVVSGMVGKEAFISSIDALNGISFAGDSHIGEALLPEQVGYGDGLSILISDFLTDNDYESGLSRIIEKKRDLLCVQILTQDELDPLVRGKVHFFDSENETKTYRKNIDRDIARAYQAALQYTVERIKSFCEARNASYLLVEAEEPVGRVFQEKLLDLGVLK